MPMTAAGKAFYRPTTPARKQALRKRIQRAPELTARERRLLLAVFGPHYRPRTGSCCVHLVRLAPQIGLKEKQTRRLIRWLTATGYLEHQSTGRRKRNGRWLPALYRFRPGAQLLFAPEDDPRADHRRDPRAPAPTAATPRPARGPVPSGGHEDDPPGESLTRSPAAPSGRERLRRPRPDGGANRVAAAPAPAPAPDPGRTNHPGLRSKLELPAVAQALLIGTAPARRQGQGTRRSRCADQLALALDSGSTERQRGASKPLPSLSEAAVGRLTAEDPGWLERHPPGSRAAIGGQAYLVPAHHPEVATETPEALAAIRQRAVQLAAGPAGQRHDALELVRRRFPAAASSLAWPWRAHELARAAYIVARLDARATAAQPRPALDFGAVYRLCERAAADRRRPPWRDFGGPAASPAERRAAMERSLAYLESVAAAVKASPARRWRVPDDEVARWLERSGLKAQEAGRRRR